MITLVTAAYKRPYYFQRQLDAWRRCRNIENVEKMHVALGACDRLKDQIRIIDQFDSEVPFPVYVSTDDPPLGPHTAIGNLLDWAFQGDDAAEFAFFTDEDTLPGDDILEYLTWAAVAFAGDERVLSVNAHSECGQGWDGPHVRDDPYADPAVVRLKPYHNQWGWGTWRDRWEKILEPEWDWDGRNRGCDWNIQRILRDRDMLAVTPDASRTQHIGYRDGMFSNAVTLAFSEAASFREHRPPAQLREEQA